MKTYPSCLTDSQWKAILTILQEKLKRKQTLREIFDALFYLLKTGCQWWMLPKHFPSWKDVYYSITKWKSNGTIELTHEFLRETRRKAGKNESPGIGIIDSQSVNTTRIGGLNLGIDRGKKTKGRKRHIIVDTMGCYWSYRCKSQTSMIA